MRSCSTTIFLQNACLLHQYIRSKEVSNIVERPERLRALNVGISAFCARLEALLQEVKKEKDELQPTIELTEVDLAAALAKLDIREPFQYGSQSFPVQVHRSKATLNLLDHAAVKYVHGDIERDVYLENLIKWAKQSRDKILSDGTEIPESLSQGDLYLCPTSLDAIEGALGTVCEAVDAVVTSSRSSQEIELTAATSPGRRVFVAIRPPGHHCGENTPSGFCFVNNVVVGAAHAHLKHGINRVIIFDIDLHHGNGTQSLVWQINEETYRQQLAVNQGAPLGKPGLQVFYGSLHDILSYPCEDGKLELVQAASVSIHGPHGQYVENIHLLPYDSEQRFWKELYEERYSKIFHRAFSFVEETAISAANDDVLVFISCGFDACEHEHESMSRHGRKVPVGFYHRFAKDARAFADKVTGGRLISVLEGGYSDRALTSGIMAHIAGLVEDDSPTIPAADPQWWSTENLATLEKAVRKRRKGRKSLGNDASPELWVQRTLEILATIDTNPPTAQAVVPASSMPLRDRSKGESSKGREDVHNVNAVMTKNLAKVQPPTSTKGQTVMKTEPRRTPSAKPVKPRSTVGQDVPPFEQKKLPRIKLKLGSPPSPPAQSGSKSHESS